MSKNFIVCAALGVVTLAGCDASDTTGGGGSTGSGQGGTAPTGANGTTGTDASSSSKGSSGVTSSSTGTPPTILPCDSLAPIGTFEDITPPTVAQNDGMGDKGGTFAIATDPVHEGVLYMGTIHQGLWKTSDCGANWDLIADGMNGDNVGTGMNWTLAVDPVEPDTVYTNSGYGSNGSGLYKSLDAGMTWSVIWPPAGQPELGEAFTYNFANVIAIDPDDHQHILLTFHESCLPPHPETCIAESSDAGATWRLIDGNAEWSGNEGQVIFFLEDSTTWLWGSQSNGFWRVEGSGTTTTAVPGMTTSHLQGSELVHMPDGSFLVSGADGIWKSPDGQASTWAVRPDTGPIAGGVILGGSTLYTSNCYFGGFCDMAKFQKSTDGGESWTEMPGANASMGGTLAFDPGHGLLYSSGDHLLRVRVR